ncbi:hypothetical protein CMI47_05705 [Candidatus Pacearchaeota archaeon]|jgi:hypothetical protein|nr:hypothetical protein [Candidatus Pacearchaeota archaeon]|tara:strand:- start:245 stop:553 length:309 start_codon:yes stop_codon:yes gene_type:complete
MVAKEAHTPGPWAVFPYYYERGDGEEHRLIGLGQFDTIADVRMGSDDVPGDLEANACLIAAAPELLEALEGLLPDFTGGLDPTEPECVVKARAAIAKARGEA